MGGERPWRPILLQRGSGDHARGCLSGVRGGLGTGRHASMRAGQPLAQFLRGLVRRRSIKRHQRCRDSRHPDEVCPPVEGVGRDDLDVVRPTTDGFEEAMNSRVHSYGPTRVVSAGNEKDCHASVAPATSEAPYEDRVHSRRTRRTLNKPSQNSFSSTSLPQVMHRSSTGFPQRLDASDPPPYA